jgi:regulator of protease activity HflC (stomatin/prohibitin superfamily)
MKMLVMLALMTTLASCGFEVVDTGRRGIKVDMGQVVGEPLPEGIHFYNPATADIIEMNVREVAETYKLNAYSKDNQQIDVVVNVVAAPVESKVGLIYKQYGEDFMEKLGQPVVVAAAKDILGQYTADNIVSERAALQKKALHHIQEKLLARYVNVTGVEFTNIQFQPEYEKAVEAKVVAIQHAERAKNETEEIREKKEQAILEAQGQAEAMRIKANALASNPKLVEYEWVQKWDGKDNRTHVFSNGSAISIMTK